MNVIQSRQEKELENLCTMEEFPKHKKLTKRLKKTFYYGYNMPKTDRPSLPLTEIAVELFQDASPKDLGQVDTFLASSMARKACMSPCSMMLGMIYIERLKNRNPEYVQKMSSADLFLLSMMMASKYLYDEGTEDEVFNDEWAESADIDLEDLNQHEKNYLSAIDWRLFVEPSDFWRKMNQVEKRIAWEKCTERGWMTYTDIWVLSDYPGSRNIVLALSTLLSKVVIVCSVAYAAAVGTILASTMVTMALKERLPVQPITSPVSPWVAVESGSHLSIDQMQPMHRDQGHEELLVNNETDDDVIHGLMTSGDVEQSFDDVVKKSQPLGIPGLLTLALLQDTVCQFIDGVKLKIKQGYGEQDQSGNVENRCVQCKDCGHGENVVTQAPANSSGLLRSMYASQLRCTCGKQNKTKQKPHKSTENHLQKGEGRATKLWNLAARSLSGNSKHRREQEGQGGDQENGCPCCCGDGKTHFQPHSVLNLPISELVLTHGQTLPTLSVAV